MAPGVQTLWGHMGWPPALSYTDCPTGAPPDRPAPSRCAGRGPAGRSETRVVYAQPHGSFTSACNIRAIRKMHEALLSAIQKHSHMPPDQHFRGFGQVSAPAFMTLARWLLITDAARAP